MERVKTQPFQVLRIPGLNGEWIDLHVSESGTLCIDTSGYIDVDPGVLVSAIQSLMDP